jgi:hypothetical protein
LVIDHQVADFGTVRADDRHGAADGLETRALKTHAQTQMIVGTGPYMPPECKLLLIRVCESVLDQSTGLLINDHWLVDC